MLVIPPHAQSWRHSYGTVVHSANKFVYEIANGRRFEAGSVIHEAETYIE
jgi:hypothetical protein